MIWWYHRTFAKLLPCTPYAQPYAIMCVLVYGWFCCCYGKSLNQATSVICQLWWNSSHLLYISKQFCGCSRIVIREIDSNDKQITEKKTKSQPKIDFSFLCCGKKKEEVNEAAWNNVLIGIGIFFCKWSAHCYNRSNLYGIHSMFSISCSFCFSSFPPPPQYTMIMLYWNTTKCR